jgi:hypothetical protein
VYIEDLEDRKGYVLVAGAIIVIAGDGKVKLVDKSGGKYKSHPERPVRIVIELSRRRLVPPPY